MDGDKRKFFKKHQNNQFKRKGVRRKEKWNNFSIEQSLGNSLPADTVYRILCPSKKIGGVIGKGGSIVKALREETQAKITVADSIHGSDERVIIIYSSPEKISGKNEQELMEPHCAAQDALLKVHDQIVEEDLFGGMTSDGDTENRVVTARLLVPNNMVGCVLGKGGDVIQRLRSETGACIRVLPPDHLPTCAMSSDELVQISGKVDMAKKALYQVSTLLHQNPRKDKPLSAPMPYSGQSFHPHGGPIRNMLPPGNPMLPHRSSTSQNMPPVPWTGGYSSQPSGFGTSGFNSVPPGHGREPAAEFSMKILCSAGKIGGVIGKGGSSVKLIQQDTGASIHVEDASAESDERVIRISAFEALPNPRSQTIEAALQLQNKTSELSEKGTITTRLLVPSSKVGCILGQRGQVINEMRRRTLADIRVYSKDDKPKCASEDEELVQISGNFNVAKDALAEIASRLRARSLRDVNAAAESGPASVQGFRSSRSVAGRGPPLSSSIGASNSGGYEPLRGGRQEYEPRSYPVPPPAAIRYPNVNNALEASISNNRVNSVMGTGGSNYSNVGEVAGARMKFQDPQSEPMFEVRGSSDYSTSAQTVLHAFMGSDGRNMNAHQSSYPNNSTATLSTYPIMNPQQSPYRNVNVNSQQSPYSSTAHQGVYTSIKAPQGAYYNIGAPQGNYQY